MTTATLSFDTTSNRWKAVFNGNLIASSGDKEYVISSIRNGLSNKARKFGVTDVIVKGESADIVVENPTNYFSINERFDFLAELTNMVIDGTAVSLLITGQGGLGKSFTVNSCIKAAGLTYTTDFQVEEDDEEYDPTLNTADVHVIKGFSTAKGLYRTLWENNGKLVVFDDCDSILKDANALNLLKGALDSSGERWISWNAEAKFGDDLPRKFLFTGRIIFISNKNQEDIDDALKSRSLRVDVSMTRSEVVERMSVIAFSDSFMPEVSHEMKRDAISFIDEVKEQATNLSLRELISVVKIRESAGDKWKRLALYTLTA